MPVRPNSRLQLLQDQLRQQHPGGGVRGRAAEVGARGARGLGQSGRPGGATRRRRRPSSFAARARSERRAGRSSAVAQQRRASRRSDCASSSRRAIAIANGAPPPRPAAAGSIATTVPSIEARPAAQLLVLADERAAGPGLLRAHALERGDDVRVRRCRRAPRPRCAGTRAAAWSVSGPEQPVLTARVEPERVQLPLERADVVAAEAGRVQVQGAVAQPVAGLDELAPGVGPDQAVDPQVAPAPGSSRTAASVDGPNAPRSSAGVDERAERRSGAAGCRGSRGPRRRGR